MMLRRTFLRLAGGAALAAPGVALAAAPTERRLVVVVLRGGLDALHAVPPWADADYRRLRPTLAVAAPGQPDGALDLDGTFGLHPALEALHPLYASGELAVLHAAATSYRKRSHFDGQNQLENGGQRPFGQRDGWLNRAIGALQQGERRLGLALGTSVPLMLQGEESVASWADSPLPDVDEGFLDHLAAVYEDDPLFAAAFREAQGGFMPSTEGKRGRGKAQLTQAATVTAQFLSQAQGPRIGVLESSGWDTHFGQARRLQRGLGELAEALTTLRDGLGSHWKRTVVLVVSEFGRTAAENGSRGTDHGVGGLALLLGGAVRGGRILGEWPGLSARALYEGRDLRPTTAYESLFKGVLLEHLGLSAAVVEQQVFPGSAHLRPLRGLVRR